MNLDDLLEEFKDEHQNPKKGQIQKAKGHHLNYQDSATFTPGVGAAQVAHQNSKFAQHDKQQLDDPWAHIPTKVTTISLGGLAPPASKQLYAQQSAGNVGWDDEDEDEPNFGGK